MDCCALSIRLIGMLDDVYLHRKLKESYVGYVESGPADSYISTTPCGVIS